VIVNLPLGGGESDFGVLDVRSAAKRQKSQERGIRMADEMSERLRSFARAMRKDPTKAENMLWQMLRGRKLERMKFKRQEPMGPYIVDFVCHERKLIIEADGGQHSESASDLERDRYFEAKGYRILRFWNDEIECNSDAAALHIIKVATDA